MLGYLEGKIISKQSDSLQCILLSGGVGYELNVHKRLYDNLKTEQTESLWVYTVMRETALSLYGFSSESEKHFFKLLLGVNGLGPRTAMALLSEHGADVLAGLILKKQADRISSAPGVGKKTAQRIVVDLGTKLEKWSWLDKLSLPIEDKTAAPLSDKPTDQTPLRSDLSSALTHLGYQPNQVRHTLDKLFKDEATFEKMGFEKCLKTALKDISLNY